jgi:acyl transferase domain-containing protein
VKDVAIAVVGMSCRFPGANSSEAFWENITRDVCSIRELPPSRFHASRYYDPEIGAYGKSYCKIGGLVDPPPFDPAAFRMPPKVVASTDECHVWALEVARQAFVDAGYDPFALEGQNIGVIVGHARGSMLTSDMGFATAVEGMIANLRDVKGLAGANVSELQKKVVRTIHDRYPKRTEDGGTGTMTSALAGLITNTFGLMGRHMVVDAACASSLAAVDVGVSGLAQGKLDAALVGGASYSQEMSVVMFAQSRALSPDGSFPFDQRANGFISSDGFGLLLLKRLDDALRDGNKVRAVIRGVGGSCDGKGKALWAPRKEGQILAMRRAYERAGVDPQSIGLIEAHATSTPLGDRTEIEALHDLYRSNGGTPLPIGGVKGNIGHCREAAGAAGLVKAILALEHQTLPPTGNFRTPSKDIPWNDVAVEVVTTPRPWSASGVRRAGVNAFGIGGLNYHVILEEAPPERRVFAAPKIVSEPRPRPHRADVAIVGIGGKFPQAATVAKFWENLIDAKDVAIDVPADRWDRAIYHAPGDRQHYRTYLGKGAFITGFEADWRRYTVPPKLVERNDPLQFMLLESALDAFADAGIDVDAIDRARVGVIIGSVFGSDYALDLSLAIRSIELAEVIVKEAGREGDRALFDEVLEVLRRRFPSINEDSSGSFSSSTLASRTAKTLDLMGPTYAVDAACASSVASLEAAVELLRSGLVDHVVYGGGDRGMRVQRYEAYCQFYALTKDQPRPFDRRADGFLPGEGSGICILERLEDAERAGRHIYAVVKGVGSSGNGIRGGLHKPSTHGLAKAMARALDQAGASPSDVRFIECHGGGTPLGDRTEIEAIREAYQGRTTPAVIGTVKSNLGHTQGAAGVMAVIKAALAVDKGEIPPTRGFAEPHPDHALGDDLRINAIRETFPAGSQGLRLAGVSSMGLAGVNYHAVLAAHPTLTGRDERPKTVFRIAGATAKGLEQRIGSIDPARLFTEERIGDGDHVVSIAALDRQDLGRAIAALQKAGLADAADAFRRKQGIFVRRGRPAGETRIAFAFSGQGSQYTGMMKAFAAEIPAVRRIAERFDTWLVENGGAKISEIMFSGKDIPEDVFLIQASVLAADLMAFEALKTISLSPAIVTGHSFGDYAALVAAGAWSLEDALRATKMRAAAIESAVEPGGMTSVTAPIADVEIVVREASKAGYVAIANINAPDQVVISGKIGAIERAEAILAKRSIEAKRLPIPRAFHSALMESAKAALAEGLATIPIARPKVPYVSSVTRSFVEDPGAIRSSLVDQITSSVDFVAQVKAIVSEGVTVFVEAGPRGVLTSLVGRIAPEVEAVTTDDANRPGRWSLARIEALLDARNAALAAEPAAIEAAATLALFEGDEAEALLAKESFEAFWARTKPTIRTLVENLWAAEHPVEDVALETPTAVPEPAAVASNIATREEVEQFVVAAICEQSGYPAELIDLDADLEADLGIDTVKQAQVLGKVRDKFDLRTEERLSLRDFPTLRHVLDYVEKKLAVMRTAAPRRSIVPMVDVTERRTKRPQPAAPEAREAQVTSAPPIRIEIPQPTSTPGPDAARPATVLHLTGTSREIGEQHGKALRDPILEVMHRYFAFIGDRGLDLLVRPETLPRLSALFDRPTIEEIQGIAAAVGVPYSYLLAYNLDAALFPAFAPGCTQSVRLAKNNGGSLIHLVNEDSPLLLHLGGVHPRVVQVRHRTDGPRPSRRAVFFSLAGQVVGPNAVIDSGLTLTSTTLLDGNELGQLPDGLPHPQIVKRIAEEADSLEEAAGILKGARRAGRWSLLMSDAERDRARYIEYDGDRIVTDEEIRETKVTTNHSICEPAAGCAAPEHSLLREARARTLLDPSDVLSIERAKRVLRDRHDPGRGRDVVHPTMNTVRRVDNVMSLVVSPGSRSLWVTDRVQPPGDDVDRAEWIGIEYSSRGERTASEGERTAADPRSEGFSSEARREPKPGEDGWTAAGPGSDGPSSEARTEPKASKHGWTAAGPGSDGLSSEARGEPKPGEDGWTVAGPGPDELARAGRPKASEGAWAGSADLGSDDGAPPRRSGEPPPAGGLEVRATAVHGLGAIESVEPFTSSGAGVTMIPEVMRRHVVRALAEDPPPFVKRWKPARCLVVGDGPFADAITAALRERGITLRMEPSCEAAERVLASFQPDAIGIVLSQAETPVWQLNSAAYRERRDRAMAGPFRLLRAFSGGTVFGVTFLGGALGFENMAQGTGDHGGLLGLLKAIRRERGIQVQALDLSPSENPSLAADALLRELDAGSPRLEVGLLRKKRVRLALAERDVADEGSSLPKRWLLTGGARGVTAKMALRLARLCQPVLHLVGRHRLPDEVEVGRLRSMDAAGLEREKQELLARMKASDPSFTPVAWKEACELLDKSLEIDANLAAIRDAGSEVHYHAVDVADRDAVRALLDRIGSVEGLIHGAGVEVAKPYDKKTDLLFERTVGPKVDGLTNLLALSRERPFERIVAFGSVSGRFGGHGQTDYSLANEAMSRILLEYRAKTRAKVAVIDWAAFSEVGLAARSSARAFLEQSGQAFMTPSEGANHLVRELWSDLSEPEVVVCERIEALDLDRLLPSESERMRFLALEARARSSPLLDHVIVHGDRTVAERRLDATEPFLDQHRMGSTPILPAVIGLEMLSEVASLRRERIALIDVRIQQPLKIAEGSSLIARAERYGASVILTATSLRPDGVVLEPDRVYVAGKVDAHRPPERMARPPVAGDFLAYPYPDAIDRSPGSRAIFHGPAFRCLRGVAAAADGGIGRLVVPAPASLVLGSQASEWRIPAALLDGCLQAVGLLGRLLFHEVALPAGFDRVDVSTRALEAAGEEVELVVRFGPRQGDELVADLCVIAADGPILSVQRYRAQVLPPV